MLEFVLLFGVSNGRGEALGTLQWKSKPVELIKWLIKVQLPPEPSVMDILNWEAAGVTESALC